LRGLRGWLSVVLCPLTSLFAGPAAYTNVAGKVILAEPVKLVGNKVWMKLGSRNEKLGMKGSSAIPNSNFKSPTSYPLALFPPSERLRIKEALGINEPSQELKGLWDEISAQRRRAEARAKAGKMTREELDEYNRNLDAAWNHYKGETK